MLIYNPEKRMTAHEAIEHAYFREKPFPQESSMMPTFPTLHTADKGKAAPGAHESYQQQSKRRKF